MTTLVGNDLAQAMRLVLTMPPNGFRDRWSDEKVAALLDTRQALVDLLERWAALAVPTDDVATRAAEMYELASESLILLARLEAS